MPWAVAAAAVTAVGVNVAANKASNSAEDTAKAAAEAAGVQSDFGAEASALLDPFQEVGQQGLDQAGFLTDPDAQFDFLQNNPLFQLGLDNANRVTQQSAAARGRLSAGDTFQRLNDNALLTAAPLIADQKNSIGSLLNFGQATAANQGSLLTGQGASLAGGIIGGQNALNAGAQADINSTESIAALLAGILASQGD